MTDVGTTAATSPAERAQAHEASLYDADGLHVFERKRNPFVRSPRGGRTLSALMLPFFTVLPPSGFGVITTIGRRTGRIRRKCMHVIRRGDRAYIVMLRPVLTVKTSAWVLNIRANPHVRLRIRGGTFAGVARELEEGVEMREAREAYCEAVNPFDYVECTFHRGGRPTRAKIQELHRGWFDTGIPLVVELGAQRSP
jgi:deazaflavin-dependent oxidoreductase (nitroreductase family)